MLQVPQDCSASARSEVEWLQDQAEQLLQFAIKEATQEHVLPLGISGCEQETGTAGEQMGWKEDGLSRTEEVLRKKNR